MTESMIYLFVFALNMVAGIWNGNQGDGVLSIFLGKLNMFCAGGMFIIFLDKVL